MLRFHNSSRGSTSTEPAHLQLYAHFAYICGFNGYNNIVYYIDKKWKDRREQLIAQCINESRAWSRGGNDVTHLEYSNFGSTDNNELRLVLLFR